MTGKSVKTIGKHEVHAKKKKKSDKKHKKDCETYVVHEKQKKNQNQKTKQNNEKPAKKQNKQQSNKKKAKYEIEIKDDDEEWTRDKSTEKSNRTLILALVGFLMIMTTSVLLVGPIVKKNQITKPTNTSSTVIYPEDKFLAIYSTEVKFSSALIVDYHGVETQTNYVDNDEKSNSHTRCSFVFQGQIWFLGIVSI